MVMSERTHYIIPCVSSANLLPNIAKLCQHEETYDEDVMNLREQYTKIVLLLFYPFHTQDDLLLNGSFWEKYLHVKDNNILSEKCVQVCQNIQDVSYNCTNLKQAQDELISTTSFTPSDQDYKTNSNEEENTIPVEEIADMIQQLTDYEVKDVDPTQRRLNIIGQRHKIVEQNIPIINTTIPDITDIPDGIKLKSGLITNHDDTDEQINQSSSSSTANKNRMDCAMIIDVLTDNIMYSQPNSNIMQDTISMDT